MRRLTWSVGVAALLSASVAWATGGAGDLDASFGTGGVSVTDYGSSFANVLNDLAVQADGRIVAGGTDGTGAGHWLVRRYDAYGSADSTFGGSGSITLFTSVGGSLADLALDANGRILAVGAVATNASRRGTLVRLNGDGTLDAAFGSGGTVTVNAGVGITSANAVAVQPDGKVLVAGWVTVAATKKVASHSAIFLARYFATGVLDGSFGVGGMVINDLSTRGSAAYTRQIALQSDGKIVLGGNSGSDSWVLTRYLVNGAIDGAFGVVKFTGKTIRGIAVDAFDRIVACGGSSAAGSVIVRYTATGAVDGSFGTYGATSVAMGLGAAGPAIQGDGKIAFTGTITPSSSTTWYRAVVARVLDNGEIDAAFGSGGISYPIDVFPAFTAYWDTNGPSAVAVAGDGGLLVAGGSAGGTTAPTRHFAWFLARYTAN